MWHYERYFQQAARAAAASWASAGTSAPSRVRSRGQSSRGRRAGGAGWVASSSNPAMRVVRRLTVGSATNCHHPLCVPSADKTACLWGGTQSKSESSLLLRDAILTTSPSSSTRRVPRLDAGLLLPASERLVQFRVPFLPSLRYSTRARGIQRCEMLFGAWCPMERLNAYDRSPTVKAQRSQPTGAVDFLLEPLPLACARPPTTLL